MGAGCARKTNYVIRGLGLNSGGKLENEFIHLTDDSINYAYVMKS